MAEQGLKAVVYPEIDEQGLQEFVKKFSEGMGGAYINIDTGKDGGTSPGPSSSASPSSPETSATPVTPAKEEEEKPLDAEQTSEAVKKGHKDAEADLSKDSDVVDAKNAPMKKGLGEIVGSLGSVGTSLAVGGISIVSYVQKVWDFLESSSPALRNVMQLFEQAFQLIWMPVGTIIAKKLMPVLSDVMQTVATWMGRAWDIYDEEGWSGLLSEVFAVSIEVLWKYLQGFGAVLWPVLETLGTWILDFFFEKIMGIEGGLDTVISVFTSAYEALVGLWNVLEGPLLTVGNAIWEGITFLRGLMSTLNTYILQTLGVVVEKVASGLTTVVKILTDIWNTLTGTVGNAIDTVKDFVNDPVGASSNFLSSSISTVTNTVKKVLPFLAEGGVVTEPTLGVFGEAGPEAVIPLNQLNQVANQYTTDMNISERYGGGNIMNFYITGNNATEIGGEVQRILEKTVGKASSKMMWW